MKTTHFTVLASLICATTVFAVDPLLDGDDPNAAMSVDTLEIDTTGSDTPVPIWGWTLTGNLNVARELHTATLLQNGV